MRFVVGQINIKGPTYVEQKLIHLRFSDGTELRINDDTNGVTFDFRFKESAMGYGVTPADLLALFTKEKLRW